MGRTVSAVRNVSASNRAQRPSKTTPKSGRPSTSIDDDHVEKVIAVTRQNRRLTIREVSEEVGICKSSCHLILTEKRKMRRVAASKICAASAGASHLSNEFLTKQEATVVPQPPYSPHLAPVEFFLFLNWKSSLKVRRYQTVEETEENSTRDLRAIPQNTFQDAFQNWKKKNVGSCVLRVEGSTLKETILIKL